MQFTKGKISFSEEAQAYTGKNGEAFFRVSHFLDSFKEKPDWDRMAEATAKKRVRIVKEIQKKTGRSPRDIVRAFPKFKRGVTKEQVLAEWKANNELALDRGNKVDKEIDDYLTTGKPLYYPKHCEYVAGLLTGYHGIYTQPLLYSEIGMAGRPDIICTRTSSKSSVVDIYDIKANWINYAFDSISQDQYDGSVRHNNRYFNAPISHIEECYFNRTALQLSTYGMMLEEHGWKIGKLATILLNPEKDGEGAIYYHNYMKHEVEAMMGVYLEKEKSKIAIQEMASSVTVVKVVEL